MNARRFVFVLCATVWWLGLPNPILAQATYTVTDLGTLYYQSVATAINASGQIAGYSGTSSGSNHAFLYSGGTMTDLGSSTSEAYGINGNGDVVGNAAARGFLYSGGTVTDLGAFASGTNHSKAYGINDNGQIVGYSSYDINNHYDAFVYSGGTMTDLNTTDHSLFGNGYAYAINANGDIVGQTVFSGSAYGHAFLDSSGTITDLGTLGGSTDSSGAKGINVNGDIVGWSYLSASIMHAFLYTGGSMTDLGTLGGSTSQADGINANGQIVGFATNASSANLAFVYQNGTMTDLNLVVDLTGTDLTLLTEAYAINDSGQIVGVANTTGPYPHAFLLTPLASVAEPGVASLVLGLLALGATVAWYRRRIFAARAV